jgi:hypothetical protein
MSNLIKNMKPNPFVIVIIFIVLAILIAYSITVKKEVQVNLYNDFFTFKASD